MYSPQAPGQDEAALAWHSKRKDYCSAEQLTLQWSRVSISLNRSKSRDSNLSDTLHLPGRLQYSEEHEGSYSSDGCVLSPNPLFFNYYLGRLLPHFFVFIFYSYVLLTLLTFVICLCLLYWAIGVLFCFVSANPLF